MFLVALSRSFAFAVQSFFRNIWLSLATIFIIFLAFMSINFLIVLNAITDSAISAVKEKIDVSVNFKPEVRESSITDMKTHLETMAQIEKITYTSPEENLENFKQKHLADQTIQETLDELKGNPLGATLTIRAKNLADYPEILKAIDNPAYTELIENKSYDDHQIVIDRINTIADNVRKGGLAISFIFVIISALIVFNTVRIAIFTHKNEIGIMKLVGATNWFIRAPFIIESIISGILACLISIGTAYAVISLIQPQLANFFGGTNFNILNYFNHYLLVIIGGQIGGIIVLNFISSNLAINKYLDV